MENKLFMNIEFNYNVLSHRITLFLRKYFLFCFYFREILYEIRPDWSGSASRCNLICNCQESKSTCTCVRQSHILRGKTNGDFCIKASFTHYQIYLFCWDHLTSVIYVTIFASGFLKILFYTSVFVFDETFSIKL